MESRHLVVLPLDDAPSLEIRHFCDSGMKCFGEHDLFQQLASFLHRNTAVKLYSSGKTFKSLVKRTFSGLLLRLAMTSLFEEQGVGKLPCLDWKSMTALFPISKQDHFHIMHKLTRVLQNGLNLHRREPGATMVWIRYFANQPSENGTGVHIGRRGMCLPIYVRSSWHLSWHNVGILMATREQYANAFRGRRSLDLELMIIRRRLAIEESRWFARHAS